MRKHDSTPNDKIDHPAQGCLGAGDVTPAPAVKANAADRTAEAHGVTLTASFRRVGLTLLASARGPTPLHRDLVNLDSTAARAKYANALVAAA